MIYLIKWKKEDLGLVYEKEIEASNKAEAIKKFGKKIKFAVAIYLKLN